MLPASARPYVTRAIYEWCLDAGFTPYILVAVTHPGVRVPQGYEREGKITLNIAPKAVNSFEMTNDRIRFSARFGATVYHVEVPMMSVVAVFAAETHEGMVFGDPPPPPPRDPDAPQQDAAADPAPVKSKGERPKLRLVK